MAEGTIKRWIKDKDFGFIYQAGQDQEVFCHRTALADPANVPNEGDAVTFEIEDNAKGPRAQKKSVRIVDKAPDSPPTPNPSPQPSPPSPSEPAPTPTIPTVKPPPPAPPKPEKPNAPELKIVPALNPDETRKFSIEFFSKNADGDPAVLSFVLVSPVVIDVWIEASKKATRCRSIPLATNANGMLSILVRINNKNTKETTLKVVPDYLPEQSVGLCE